jgi:hypothetical protein
MVDGKLGLASVLVVALAASCSTSGDGSTAASVSASSKSAPSAVSASAVASVTPRSTAAGFDDVPAIPAAGAPSPSSILVAHISELPAGVTTLQTIGLVSARPVASGLARASTAAGFFCGAPPLSRIASRAGAAFYGAEAAADALADPRLRDWIDCGRRSAIASRWVYDEVGTGVPHAAHGGSVRFYKDPGEVVAPAYFEAPGSAPNGLDGLRCDAIVDGACTDHALAVARFPAWSAIGIGDFASVVALARSGGPAWPGANTKLAATDLAGRDVMVSTGDAAGFGFLEMGAGSPDAYTALEALRAEVTGANGVLVEAWERDELGRTFLEIDASSAPAAKKIATAVDKLAEQVAKSGAQQSLQPPHARSTNGTAPDFVFWEVVTAMSQRASKKARATVSGSTVRIEATLVPTGEEQAALDRANADKERRFEAWGRLLDARLRGAPLERSDLVALGGQPFADAFEAHVARVRQVVPTLAVDGFSELSLPKPRDVEKRDKTTRLTYPGNGGHLLTDILDALRAQGFEPMLNTSQPTLVRYALRRGATALALVARVTPSGLEIELGPG